jgi:hypothetical protein
MWENDELNVVVMGKSSKYRIHLPLAYFMEGKHQQLYGLNNKKQTDISL